MLTSFADPVLRADPAGRQLRDVAARRAVAAPATTAAADAALAQFDARNAGKAGVDARRRLPPSGPRWRPG
jgi:hypothetical protein